MKAEISAAPARIEAPLLLVRGLVICLAASWIGYYIIIGMPQIRPHVFTPTITLHIVTACLALLYVFYLAYSRRLPGGSPLDWAIVAMLAAYALATVAAVDWRVSLEQTLQVGLVILVFYALADVHALTARDVQWALMLAGGAASVYALYVVSGDYRDWLALRSAVGGEGWRSLIPPTVPRLHDVSDHPNILGMTLVLVVPFYLLAMLRGATRWEQAAGGAGLLLAAGALFFTLSRGAWLGATAAVVVTGGAMVALLFVFRPGRSPADWLRGRQRGALSLVVLLAVAGMLVVAAVIVAGRWHSRPGWLFRESLSPREDAMGAGAEMFQDHPWLGTGPGGYALLYPEYSGRFPVQSVHSHNGFLQVAIDLGIPGVLAMLGLAAVTGFMLWRVLRRGKLDDQLLAIAAGGALVGFGVHNLLDAANIWRAALVGLAAVGAIIVKLDRGDGPPPLQRLPARTSAIARRLAGYLPAGALLAGLALMLLAWWRYDSVHYYYSRSLERMVEGRWPAAIDDAREAVGRDPDYAPYHELLGVQYLAAAQNGGPQTLVPDAVHHLQLATRLEPRSGMAYANLARALLLAGSRDDAVQAAETARRLAVADVPVKLAAAAVLEDAGASDQAIAAYGDAITANAGLADSGFWDGSDFRRQNYGRILDASIIGFNQCTLGRLVVERQARGASAGAILGSKTLDALAQDCKLRVLGNPGDIDQRVALADILIATGDLDGAWDHVSYAVSRRPDDGPALTVEGKWHQAKGDQAAARHDWLLAAQVGDAQGAVLLGDSYPPGQVPQEVRERLEDLLPQANAGSGDLLVDVLWYRMKFWRESPIIILVPGDWQNAVPAEGQAVQDALRRWDAAAPASG